MVQAKFKVTEIIQREGADPNQDPPVVVILSPVKGEPFGKYTPSGSINMTITNKAASDQFEVGKEYLVEFKPAE